MMETGLKRGIPSEILMTPRQRFFECLQRSPPALFEAALWIAAEHDKL